jgi:tetraacyldisaccharide-1-P 4'-kinase
MKTTILANRDLTVGERFAIDRFSYYFNEGRPFAVIGDNAVVVMESVKSHEEIIKSAKTAMGSILSTHPDCSSYIMDDGNVMIEMNYNVYSVADGKKEGIKTKDEEVPVGIAINVRGYCLQAAERNEVIAIVEPEITSETQRESDINTDNEVNEQKQPVDESAQYGLEPEGLLAMIIEDWFKQKE